MILRRLLPLLLLACACAPGGGLPDTGCRQDLDCPSGQLCQSGVCEKPVHGCPSFYTPCGSACVDVTADPYHCGACDQPCPDGRACVDGACCPAEAKTTCSGACTDLTSDAANCGICGALCGDGQVCVSGICCAPGELACDGTCRAVAADPGACGACDRVCPAGAACVDGACAACPAGTALVDCGPHEACLPPEAPRDPCMALVPAGTFPMGYAGDMEDTQPVHEVTLTRGFWLDLHEVTEEQYFRCVEAALCVQNGVLNPQFTPHLPAVWLSRADAAAYCAFRGDRLPTEAEWSFAAQGTDGRPWPWGGALPTCAVVNFNQCGSNLRSTGGRPGGAGPFGHLDLAGNAGEWVSDWYAPYAAGATIDPRGPAEGLKGTRRGGHFDSGATGASSYGRDEALPDYFDSTTGVRCVRELP